MRCSHKTEKDKTPVCALSYQWYSFHDPLVRAFNKVREQALVDTLAHVHGVDFAIAYHG